MAMTIFPGAAARCVHRAGLTRGECLKRARKPVPPGTGPNRGV